MNRTMLPVSLALASTALILTGCGDRSASEDAATRTEYPREVLAAHMRDHFYKVTEMQVAVINADLEALREPATWMAEHANSAAMPASWMDYAGAMREAATNAAEAGTLDRAARATARVAVACGNCHQALSAEVGFESEPPALEGDDVAPHMSRHAWAAGRLWEGMIVPSGVLWDEGAAALAEAPLTPAQLDVDLEVLADVSAIEAQVHELGATAMGLTPQDERAELYGRFLSTCAACHQKVGRPKI